MYPMVLRPELARTDPSSRAKKNPDEPASAPLGPRIEMTLPPIYRSWVGGSTSLLPSLAGKRVRIKVAMRDARLFSVSVACAV